MKYNMIKRVKNKKNNWLWRKEWKKTITPSEKEYQKKMHKKNKTMFFEKQEEIDFEGKTQKNNKKKKWKQEKTNLGKKGIRKSWIACTKSANN